MSEIRVTSVLGENGSDPVGLSTGFTVGPTSGTTATITHEGQASFTGIVTATSFVPTTGQLSHRNLIINGAMQVAQRGTSSASSGYQTVDRFFHSGDGWDAAMTQAQGDVASGTTPYTQGFRKTFKLTNGNQTSGAGAGDTLVILNRIEAQDLANSGWNYTSSSSSVSFSFWVKSSVAQNFFFTFKSGDGTPQKYAMETGSLTADTWTKITKTIPGNSNIQFDNDNGEGLEIEWSIFRGTDQTGSMSLNSWAANNNSVRTPDQASTWYDYNNATFEITGVQLEVGSSATAFENRTFADELRRCQRYCFRLGGGDTETYTTLVMAVQSHSTLCKSHIQFPVQMRSKDITYTYADLTVDDDVSSYAAGRIQSINSDNSGKSSATLIFNTSSMGTVNPTRILTDDVGGYIQGECEL